MEKVDKVLLIDKEPGWTSFDVVAKVRGILRSQSPGVKIKVGHAGTLDPFATGLLIILVGKATRRQDEYMKQDKEYEAILKFGFKSSTGDPEGTIKEIKSPNFKAPDEAELKKILKEKFTGEMEQTPPMYSAIKVNGQRAYKLARAGKEVELKPRKITLYNTEVLEYEYPVLKIKVKCSSGTYIRTLAEDIGKALGTGAYLRELRRTKIGDFSVSDALKIEELTLVD
jgi:tRNA pseudouridine55 synthase